MTVKGFSLISETKSASLPFFKPIKITSSPEKCFRYRFAFLSHTPHPGLLSQLLNGSNFKGGRKKLNSLMWLRNRTSYSERDTARGSCEPPVLSQVLLSLSLPQAGGSALGWRRARQQEGHGLVEGDRKV